MYCGKKLTYVSASLVIVEMLSHAVTLPRICSAAGEIGRVFAATGFSTLAFSWDFQSVRTASRSGLLYRDDRE